MQIELKSINGKTGSLELNDAVFACDFKETLIHQVVTAYMAAGRAGTKAQKNRSAVSGGGAKPFKQKGTGRARAGTTRGPIWRKGGVTFAASPRNYAQKINKKMYRAAIRSIFSELLRLGRLQIVDVIELDAPKTKEFLKVFSEYSNSKLLLIADEISINTFLASRNLHNVIVSDVVSLDPVSLVGAEQVLITESAVKKIEEWLV